MRFRDKLLIKAVENGWFTFSVGLLLTLGANPNIMSNAHTSVLMRAIEFGSTKVAALLLRRGANPNFVHPFTKTSPLMMAVVEGNVAIVELLIGHKINLELHDRAGDTALYQAVIRYQYKIVELLVKAGADIKSRNNRGLTLLQYAQYQGNKRMIDLLQNRAVEE